MGPNTYLYLTGGLMGLARCLRNQKNKRFKIFLQQLLYYCSIKCIHKYLMKSQVHKIRDFLKDSIEQMLKFTYLATNAIVEKKISLRWVGFQKSYVIFRVGHGKCLRPLTRWVGGVKKGQKHAYLIFEWSLTYSTKCNFKKFM